MGGEAVVENTWIVLFQNSTFLTAVTLERVLKDLLLLPQIGNSQGLGK